MRCPRCNQDGMDPCAPCAHCGFSGPPAQVEELGHLAYLLDEIDTWSGVPPTVTRPLRERYQRRRSALEQTLGVQPPLTPAEARTLQWQRHCLQQLEDKVHHWLEQDWIQAGSAKAMADQARSDVQALNKKLTGAPQGPAPAFDTVSERLGLIDYLLRALRQAKQGDSLTGDQAYQAALAELMADRDEIEIQAGLKQRPRPVEAAPTATPAMAEMPAMATPAPAAPRRPPRQPLTLERLWQTLLSERTLNVILFLGAFLLIASAITYVVANWSTLPPWAQLAAIVLFTLSFYGGGWFMRTRMNLRASGMALTAVGSLLVPLDFYAVFIAGGFWPAERWPWVWLMASAVCLPIYIFTALRLRAQFFGYVVAAAGASLMCAALQVLGVGSEWWLLALVSLALLYAALAYRFRSDLLSAPLRFSALVGTAVILPLGIGWWLALGIQDLAFDVSLAGSWLLGGLLFAYTAVQDESPLLGRLAAPALAGSVVLLERLAFRPLNAALAWYALGWAILGPVSLLLGRRLIMASQAERLGDGAAAQESAPASPADAATVTRAPGAVLRAHGHTAVATGLALMTVAALCSVANLWAAATTHAVLAAGVVLVVRAWDRPRILPVASLLAFSAATFAMAAGHLEPAELAVGWALLALLHVVVAISLRQSPAYAAPLFAAVFPLAGLAILAPLILGHEPLLTYSLANWIAVAAWWLWLDHSRQHPGLEAVLDRFGRLRPSILHWAIAVPLPFLAGLVYTRFRAPDAWLGLLLAFVSWTCFAVTQLPRLKRTPPDWGQRPVVDRHSVLRHWWFPWSVVAYACSAAAPVMAYYDYQQPLLGSTVLLAAALYFTTAWTSRRGLWLALGGLALPVGVAILLDYAEVDWAEQSVILAFIAAAYLLGGVWLERWRGLPRSFSRYLAGVGHVVAAATLLAGLLPALQANWLDAAKLWAAGGALVLAVAYGLLAWFENREIWAHVAAWLSVLAGGLVALAYGQGRGSSALKVALLAVLYVAAERILYRIAHRSEAGEAGRAWPLYRRPLLIAGWSVSAAAIVLALGRNLVLLGGGLPREAWSIAGLVTITALYAASAWLFRRRVFLWLAGGLLVVPWTLLTAWGWFIWAPPTGLRPYALSWAILAALELIAGLLLSPSLWLGCVEKGEMGFPLRAWANLFLPFALMWGLVDSTISSLSFEIGIAFYLLSALVDHWRGLSGWRAARFLYPAAALLPAWALYLLHTWLPDAPYELYGLLLLALALPLLIAGRRLNRVPAVGAADALPFYLSAYGVAIAGTLLVASQRPLAAAALTFDLLLCVLSVRLFREPGWGYPAVALAPAALLLALAESAVPLDRRGWLLIALGAVYLLIAWLLRRVKRPEFAVPPLAAAFVVIALGLLPSSLDDVGAFWGYLAAALLYAVAAAWLRQPLLLTPALGLLAVPYGVALANLPLARVDYGLALFPGVIVALALAHALDARLGQHRPVVSSVDPRRWRLAPLLDWWGAPAYGWGYLAALAAVGLSWSDSGRLAIALLLASATFFHATWRFRRREALLVALGLAQAAALAALDIAGWLQSPGWASLGFLPVTVATAAMGLAVEHRRGEGSPLGRAWWSGWSRPFYLLLAVDLIAGQVAALSASEPGAVVTIVHALLLATLATAWANRVLPAVAASLGIAGLWQALSWAGVPSTGYPVGLALLALGYGLIGYGLRALRQGTGEETAAGRRAAVWLLPLEWISLGLSGVALVAGLVLGVDIVRLVVQAVLRLPFIASVHSAELRMAMWVLAVVGLLYLATAVVHRWRALGYGALAMLLAAWALWWRFFVEMSQFQWYAVPAGLYLFFIGWSEWRSGNHRLGQWVDRAGMLVWLGSSWWQSLSGLDDSWPYALLMGVEGLLLIAWGSARRQKQLLYAGMVAVILDVVTQSIEPLLTVNRWIVFGLAGILLVSLAVLVERRLEHIRRLSADLRTRLEAWE